MRTPHRPNQLQRALAHTPDNLYPHLPRSTLFPRSEDCAAVELPPSVPPEELCQQVVFMLEMVLSQYQLERGWGKIHQCAAHNHLAVMRAKASAGLALQEAAYFEHTLDYAERLRNARSAGIAAELRGREELLPALRAVNSVLADMPKSVVQEAGLYSAEAVVLLECYTCAATAVVLGIDAPEIWPVPRSLWFNVQGLQEYAP